MNEKMTLEEFFALADRVAGALNVLREARGEAPVRVVETLPSGRVVDKTSLFEREHPARAPVTNKGAIQWTPEEIARKEALRQKQAETMPVDPVMAAMEASDEP